MLSVVAAIIESNGNLLVCQRRRGSNFEMMWEFPGGKRKSGETPEEALARELSEELGVDAQIGREIHRSVHRYAELGEPIELIFFKAKVDAGEVRNRVFEQIQWRHPRTLPELDFLPADRELIDRIASGVLDDVVFGTEGSERQKP
jgi:8-oxo-dGTP diphosphatase